MKFLKIAKILLLFLIITTFIFLCGFLVSKYLSLNYFQINNVKVYENDQLNDSLSNKLCFSLCGKNMVFVKSLDIKQAAEVSLKIYNVLDIKYDFPDTISIMLSEKDYKSVIKAKNGFYKVDSKYIVLSKLDNNQTYNIEYDKDLDVGLIIEDDILKSSIDYTHEDYKIKVENNRANIFLESGVVLRLPDRPELVHEVSSNIIAVVRKFNLESNNVKEVDLRFSKPILRY